MLTKVAVYVTGLSIFFLSAQAGAADSESWKRRVNHTSDNYPPLEIKFDFPSTLKMEEAGVYFCGSHSSYKSYFDPEDQEYMYEKTGEDKRSFFMQRKLSRAERTSREFSVGAIEMKHENPSTPECDVAEVIFSGEFKGVTPIRLIVPVWIGLVERAQTDGPQYESSTNRGYTVEGEPKDRALQCSQKYEFNRGKNGTLLHLHCQWFRRTMKEVISNSALVD